MPYGRGPGRYVRRLEDSPLPRGELNNECLATFESATFIRSYVPAGRAGRPFHVHPTEQLYLVLDGELEVTIGGTVVTARRHELVIIPRGFPHMNVNRSDADELHLEMFIPSPAPWPAWTVDAEPNDEPAPYALVRREDPAKVITYPQDPGYRSNILADRSSGFAGGHIRIDRMEPGGSGPGLHMHKFDQFYFVLEGVLSVEVAGERHDVEPHGLAIMANGAPHRQWNGSGREVKWVTMNLPEPQSGARWDAPITSFEGDFSYTPKATDPF